MSKYPEHDKLDLIKDQSQTIGEFLANCGYELCDYSDRREEYIPLRKSIQDILAEYFEIDRDVLEAEKQAMLDEIRSKAV